MKRYLCRLLGGVLACTVLLAPACALTVEEAVELLETYYVDDLPSEVYQARDLEHLFAILGDPYTYYMNAEEFAAFNAVVENTASLVGIGVQVNYTEGGIHIGQVVNGGPAEAAGIQAGDVIVAVDGVSCVPATETVGELVRGEAGTSVTVTVRHADDSLKDYILTRAEVAITNTNISVLDGHIGVINCTSFGEETGKLVQAGIQANEEKVDLWWMDLRDNVGGLASTAVETIGMFIGEGAHLYYRNGQGEYLVTTSSEPYITQHPIIVLTNIHSASAAELFAADVRDARVGISVGGRTFGKGVAQILLDQSNLPDFFTDDGMKVTTYRFFSAGTNTTDLIGVIPTLLVADEDTEGVARLLSGREPEDSEGWLMVNLCGLDWYIDLAQARSKAYVDSFSALLAALPPDSNLFAGMGGTKWAQLPVNVAYALFDEEVNSRWFTDVGDSTYEMELNVLATYNILQGDGEGGFQPKETLTRAQLCALLAQALGVSARGESLFSDVAEESWSAPYITAMKLIGMVEGYEDGTFRPDETVSNEQFITIISRLATFLNASLYDVAEGFTEEDLAGARISAYPDWTKEGACLMAYVQDLEAPILYSDLEHVDPDAPILREQAGATLYNLLSRTGILRY